MKRTFIADTPKLLDETKMKTLINQEKKVPQSTPQSIKEKLIERVSKRYK